ncbi:hypothetical protein FZ103_17200 [Streptomonospora sp. PA3]|uniref:hypothetical protein n=1 Tax=Streptomonospora sp. PA3 TaxID=2607326 RepID=UPI0012DD2E73|nr:hypothetical protein [Streptomonospora sp. PA3]MUL42884.1 hypothetical protein [Streptomonospora sp. PA3]
MERSTVVDAERIFLIVLLVVFAALFTAVVIKPGIVPRRTSLRGNPRTRAFVHGSTRFTAVCLLLLVAAALFHPDTWS